MLIKKGFSVAEAMVALAIGGVVLGMSAPMVSKQIQNQNLSDAQYRLIIQKLEEDKNPKGTIILFDSNSVNASAKNNGCPKGYTNISEGNSGKYLMLDTFSNAGKVNKPYFPNHWHGVGAFDDDINNDVLFYNRKYKYKDISLNGAGFCETDGDNSVTSECFDFGANSRGHLVSTRSAIKAFGTTSEIFYGNAEIEEPTNEIEVKPASISVIACRKD